MEVDDGARGLAAPVHPHVEEGLLGRLVAADVPAGVVELREARRVEGAHAHVGRRQQPAVLDLDADVARAAEGQAALEERLAEGADRLAQGSRRSRHHLQRLGEEVLAAEVARLQRQRQRPLADGSTVQGTPGSICGPIRSALTSSACTTAPERLAARHHQPPHAALDQPPRHAAPACPRPSAAATLACRAAPAPRATSSGRGRGVDQDRPSPSRVARPGERVADLGVGIAAAGRASAPGAAPPSPPPGRASRPSRSR